MYMIDIHPWIKCIDKEKEIVLKSVRGAYAERRDVVFAFAERHDHE